MIILNKEIKFYYDSINADILNIRNINVVIKMNQVFKTKVQINIIFLVLQCPKWFNFTSVQQKHIKQLCNKY